MKLQGQSPNSPCMGLWEVPKHQKGTLTKSQKSLEGTSQSPKVPGKERETSRTDKVQKVPEWDFQSPKTPERNFDQQPVLTSKVGNYWNLDSLKS